MKFLTTLALGLISLNAMALPVLYESGYGKGANLFPDHADPNRIHFIPDSGNLTKVFGKPLFMIMNMEYMEEEEEASVLMIASFNVKSSWSLQTEIDKKIAEGKAVSMVPALSSYLVMNDEKGVFYSEYEIQDNLGRFEDTFALSTYITKNGADQLALQLDAPLASACYKVSGLSPKLDAKVVIDTTKVMDYFMKKHIDSRPYTQQEIINDLAMLIKIKWIKADIKGTDASIGDYAFAVAQRLIPVHFIKTEDNRFEIRMKKQEFEDKVYMFNQRELVEKEYCIDLGVSALKDFPELLKY
jgi:hypothetical protein